MTFTVCACVLPVLEFSVSSWFAGVHMHTWDLNIVWSMAKRAL